MTNMHQDNKKNKNFSYDLIIVGLGAAGLMAAAQAKGLKTLVLEKMGQGGKKVLISGKGQCNFTHDLNSAQMSQFYGSKQNFVKHALGKWSPSQTRAWFESLGVESIVMENGKVFPKCLDAQVLVTAMLNEAIQNGCDILYRHRVIDISHNEQGFKLEVYSEEQSKVFTSKFVLLCTGGMTYGVTGSEGDGFKLAKALGHHLKEVRPALTPIYHDNKMLKTLAGVSIRRAVVRQMREGKVLGEYQDDLLMTHKGLSGPVILNNSRYFKAGDDLQLQLTTMSADKLNQYLIEQASKNGKMLLTTLIKQVCETKSIAEALISHYDIPEKRTLSELSKSERQQIVFLLTKFSVTIQRLGGAEIGMVTAGGVDTEEIVAKRMHSKCVCGLYLAGEVCDVDGDTGGYNIQWAFSSAVAAITDMVTIMEKAQNS